MDGLSDHTPDLLARLASAAEAARRAEAHWKIELARRDALILESIDQGGYSIRRVARAAGITQPAVYKAVARIA